MAGVALDDPLHGRVDVHEPLLVQLLATPAVRRLAGVHQAGAVSLVAPGRDVTRLQHSIGTLLLVRRLGGGVEQQAAALLHDAGHGAFSHVIDRVFDDAAETWHEREGIALLMASEVPEILRRHGLDPEHVLAPHGWPLLDRPAPALCADRIDYALRDAVAEGLVTVAEARAFLDDLVVLDGDAIAVRDAARAAWFAQRFADLVEHVFCDPLGIWADWVLATAIRRALRPRRARHGRAAGDRRGAARAAAGDRRRSDRRAAGPARAGCAGRAGRQRRPRRRRRVPQGAHGRPGGPARRRAAGAGVGTRAGDRRAGGRVARAGGRGHRGAAGLAAPLNAYRSRRANPTAAAASTSRR